MGAIVGVVLGTGESSRFGSPKQLLPFGDTTLLGRVVRNANASSLDRVVVVLGRASGEVRASLDFGRAEVAENTAYGTGCASSLLAELRGLHGDKAVWKLVEAYPERMRRVGLDAELPPDVDTPEDYKLALASWRDAS